MESGLSDFFRYIIPDMQKEIRFHILNDEDYLKELNSLVKLLRSPEERGSLDLKSFLKPVRRASKEIFKKRKRGEACSEHEKWLYENGHLIERASLKYSEKYVSLPSKGGELRIVSVLRFAVYHSERFDKDFLIRTLEAVQNETALTEKEIEAIPAALAYVAAEGISIIAERILYHNRMKFRAEKEPSDSKFFTSDIYNYYLLRASNQRDKTVAELRAHGVNPNGADAAFTLSVLENDELSRKFFTVLASTEDIAPISETIRTTEAYKTLARSVGFKKMSFDTRLYYLRFVADIAKKLKKDEAFVAEKLSQYEKEVADDSFGTVFRRKKEFIAYLKKGKIVTLPSARGVKEAAYFLSICLISVIATFFGVVFSRSFYALFLWLPLYFVAEKFVNRILGKTRKHRFLPRMNYAEIPPSHRTLVTVSEYIVTLKQLKESVNRLKVLKAGNGAGAIDFALLIDFAASENEESESDAELLEYLKNAFSEDGFNVFVRKRVENNGKYSGRERKRGAIEDLNFMLSSGNSDAFRFVLKTPEKPEFVVLLDSDNTVEPGGILDMVNLISHPSNACYDLLSATGRYRLETPKTAYSKRFYREGGLEGYPHYSSFFYDLFGKDVFCGKGIYRLKSYEKKLSGIFPDEKILSHDILEGAVLETASGGVVYEEAPETFVQEEERVTRWQRGDLQLLPFCGMRWKNGEGQTYRSEIPFFYRALMARNALQIASPVLLFAAFVLGFFLSVPLLITSVVVALLPFLIDFVSEIRTLGEKRRFRYAAKGIACSFLRCCEELFLLPYRAVKNITVIFSTFAKMIAKRNLLVWKTYYMSKGAGQAGVTAKMTAPFLAVCAALCVGLFFVSPILVIPFAIEAVLCLITLTVLNVSSEEKKPKKIVEEEFLKDVAYRTGKYFDFMRGSGLPADNYQERPYRGKSAVTSPTNLGFSLVADICAFYCGFRDREETVKFLTESLEKFEKLKKWKGNLYNWYAPDGTPKGSFVSSVDSGNFAACLILSSSFLREIGEAELALRFEKLFEETDLSALFDKNKELMILGYDVKTKQKTGHYDMLMSESRLTSYIVAARTRNPAVFRNLMRDYTALKGNTLLSWSGTMFEYLMAALFLRAPEGSLIRESETRAASIQRESRFRGIWGRSEGGYHTFDNELNYQYYAIGEDNLSVRKEKNLPVVTPYSTALAIGIAPRAAVKNLKRLKKMGAYGEYGFFEAVDFSEGKTKFVESYMTHHQGMLIAALTNYLHGDILIRLMEKSTLIRSASLLLTEKTSERKYPKKSDKIVKIPQKHALEYYEISTNQEYSEKIFGLTDGKIAVFGDNLGNTESRFGKYLLGRPYRTDGLASGGFFYAETKNGFRTPTVLPFKNKSGDFESGQSENVLFYKNRSAGLTLEIRKNDNFCAITKRFTVEAPTGKQVKVAYLEELVLNDADGFLSHPTFNGMFIETSYLADKKTIVAEKRSGQESGDRFYAMVIRGMDKISVQTDRMKVVGRGRSVENPLFLEDFQVESEADIGDVLEPAFAFSGITELSKDGKAIVEVTQFSANSKEELFKLLETVPHEFFRYAERSVTENKYQDAFSNDLVSRLFLTKRNSDIKSSELSANRFREYNREEIGILFRCGQSVKPLEKLINAVKCANSFGLKTFLNVSLIKNPDNRLKKAVEDAAAKLFFRDYRIVRDEEIEEAKRYSFLVLDEDLELKEAAFPKNRLAELRIKDGEARPVQGESYAIGGENGGFLENGDFLLTAKPSLPFSNVSAFASGGFVATENGGGFAFFGNSRENKQNDFQNDSVSDSPSEALLVGTKQFRRINRGASATRYSPAKITWFSDYPELSARVEEYMIADGKARIFEAEFTTSEKNPSLYYGFHPALNWKAVGSDIVFTQKEQLLFVENLKTGNSVGVRILSDTAKNQTVSGSDERFPWIKADLEGKEHRVFVAISYDCAFLNRLNPDEIRFEKAEMLRKTERFSPISVSTADNSTDILLNRWLMPQIRFSRLNARAGYYQAGGAIGFRDQLQDVVALLSAEPQRVKEQILIAAAHQYEEGDVQHWWHPPKFGIRTRISDDKLFLVLITAKYLKATGDKSILKEEIPYLVSEPLKLKELNRLEYPKDSDYTEPLLKHCLRALKSAMRYGDNGLLILGTGDWNDGIDDAGKKLKGESVVTSLLFVWAVKEFADFIEDGNLRVEILSVADKLKTALNANAFKDGQYLRLCADDRKWYGTGEGALKIDLVSESLAVLSGTADKERADSALSAAKTLVDRNLRLIKLLAPPLGKKNYLGYISKYPKGVRENGGQYTHAAIWYLMALAENGNPDEAYELFRMINPAEKFTDAEVYRKYKGEPFVLSGDVYSAKRNLGRMGWSWYTGSAAWCYVFLTESLFGVRRVGNELEILPNLPKRLDGAKMTYCFENSEYRITFRKTGRKRLTLDGVTLETGGRIPLIANRRAEIFAEC